MTNHPNRARTYWINSPRGFANAYDIGIATNRDAAADYEAHGYERISRDQALRDMSRRSDDATQAFVSASVNGADVCGSDGDLVEANGRSLWDRHELVAAVRAGATLTSTKGNC